MILRRVSFQTTASIEEIESALAGLGYISYLSIRGSGKTIKIEQRVKLKERGWSTWSDWKQISVIWGVAVFIAIAVYVLIVWGI